MRKTTADVLKKATNALRLFWRVAGFPFVLALLIVAATRDLLWLSSLWLRYGGEMVSYRKNSKTILDVYLKLEKHLEAENSRKD